jgi:beta-glucosidase
MTVLEKLIKKMTLKEKVGQLNQRLYGWKVYEKRKDGIYLTDYFKEEVKRFGTIGVIYGVFRADPWSGKDQQSGLSKDEAKVVSELIQNYLKEHTRLKIPALLSEECPHGHQGIDSVTFPTNFLVGSSWNPTLYRKAQKIVANELSQRGAHLGLISTLDVMRDPRWGRTEECFSEDPLLTAKFTEAAVSGLQEDGEIFAILKHLAGQGNAMGGHNSAPVNIGERELREIHLPAIKAGIKTGAKGCMAAYNDIDGVFCHVNEYLLDNILREEFGFDGVVMADGCALDRVNDLVEDPALVASKALTSGVDISLWDDVFPYLEQAVEKGFLSEERLDNAVLRVLEIKQALGFFEPQKIHKEKYSSDEKEKLAVELAEDSFVLLKNNDTLPLKKDKIKKVAVIGPHANNVYHQLGDYTPFKKVEQTTNILEGIVEKVTDSSIEVVYESGCNIASKIDGGEERAQKLAGQADVILITVGGSSARDFTTEFDKNGAALHGSIEMTSGENIDLSNLSLPECQIDLVKSLAKAGKPTIGIIVEGRPHSLSDVEQFFDAMLFVGYPGQQGGKAVANVLFGKNPNGRLAFSIPETAGQLPTYYNYRNTMFKEDYLDNLGRPKYEFGYGLSYTSFAMTDVSVSVDKNEVQLVIRCKITNTGSKHGAEVIQIYGKKRQEFIVPREKELIGFKKVYLSTGESKNIEIEINKEQLSYLDTRLREKVASEIKLDIRSSADTVSKVIGLEK